MLIFFSILLSILCKINDVSANPSPCQSVDLFNLDLIYPTHSTEFFYPLPREVLESYLSGHSFDNTQGYTPEEVHDLKADICDIYTAIIEENPLKLPLALITAGAPGAGKTTLLNQHRNSQIIQGNLIAYVCPDDQCLRHQTRTFQKELGEKIGDLSLNDAEKILRKHAAYNKWRPGSNAAAHLILAHLMKQHYAFYFGTTASHRKASDIFAFIKNQGYYLKLLHVTAPDNIRWASIKERDNSFVQTTEQDIQEKSKLIPQRIKDTYLKYADEIEFYYRKAANEDCVLAAKWNAHGLEIFNQESYDRIKNIHNNICESINRTDLKWEKTVESKLPS